MNKVELANDSNTPPKVLEQLANDESSIVRLPVAENPNTPPKILEQLANDKEWEVRYCVARNLNTPHYLKKYLKIQDHMALL